MCAFPPQKQKKSFFLSQKMFKWHKKILVPEMVPDPKPDEILVPGPRSPVPSPRKKSPKPAGRLRIAQGVKTTLDPLPTSQKVIVQLFFFSFLFFFFFFFLFFSK